MPVFIHESIPHSLFTLYSGQPHYQIRTHQISRQELSFGRRDHDALLTSFDEAKKVLTMKNFFNECYRFNMRCMHPAVVPLEYAVLYMIQSGSYILSPDFVSTYKKIALNEAKILWEMTHNPSDVCLQDVMTILFNPLSYGNKVSMPPSRCHKCFADTLLILF